MKISTAMALGRTMIKPLAGIFLNPAKDSGCAWGMACLAAPSHFNSFLIRAECCEVRLPCKCNGWVIGGSMRPYHAGEADNLRDCIVHLFNYHVMTRKDWTMDQLIDWVASVEPADPEDKVTEAVKENTECPELVAHS